MKITGQQLRMIAKRERKLFGEIERLVFDMEINESVVEPFPDYDLGKAIDLLSDKIAEIKVYRKLISQNTQHTSVLAAETVADLAI